jgi:ribosomal protein S12 methylthiotransferase accessory factor
VDSEDSTPSLDGDRAGTFYRLAPGMEVVPVDDEGVLFVSSSLKLRLDGASARFFADRVIPLLDGSREFGEVAKTVPDISGSALRKHLDDLTEAGVLRRDDREAASTRAPTSPFSDVLEGSGVPVAQARDRLAAMTIAVIGLESVGAQVADNLSRAGVGTLRLADPGPCRPDDLGLMPLLPASSPGRPRDQIVAEALRARDDRTRALPFEGPELTRESVSELGRGADFLVACLDRDLVAANHWVNRAAFEHGIPAVFGRVMGHRGVGGPLVIPGETPCYMCGRMRSLACADDFQEAMATEEHLDARRARSPEAVPAVPGLASMVGGLLSMELLKAALALGPPSLCGAFIEYDALAGDLRRHPFLERPDCPICKKKTAAPDQPDLTALKGHTRASGDLAAAIPLLIDPYCGVVRSAGAVHKDQSEPELPYIVRAELANSRFLSGSDDRFVVSSGKGFTRAEAEVRAVGEALERYCPMLWRSEDIRRCRRDELPGPSLDPHELVLYREEQYPGLPYDPFQEDTVIGWIAARSLGTGAAIWVPALAVLMAYEAQAGEAYLLPLTSNGLAAGPTLPDAILGAAYEVLERDGFMNLWFHRLPTEKVDPGTHPAGEVRALCEAYRRRGVEFELYRVPLDHPVHVFLALGLQTRGEGPAAVVGLGASLDPVDAARSALLEVAQVRPALRQKLRDPEVRNRLGELLQDDRRVQTLEDHDLLYASPERLSSFDFLRNRATTPFEWARSLPSSALDRITMVLDAVRELDSDILYCVMTTPDIARFGVHSARAILPGFQPIHFGRGERRLGADRLFRLPQRLGLRMDRPTIADLNDDPHPLA